MPARKKTRSQSHHSLWLAVVVAGFVGFLGGFVAFSWVGNMTSESVENVSEHSHAYDVYDVPEGMLAPALSVDVTKDETSGYNVHLVTENFVFSPENAGADHTDGQGHAHIYVDGEKVGRVYGEWYHLGDLDEGERVIRVTLNTNNHMEYAADGEIVEDVVTVVSSGMTDSHNIMKSDEAMDSEGDYDSTDAMR